MSPRLKRRLPWFLGGTILLLAGLLQWLERRDDTLELLQRLEWMTYDWRVRHAAARVATNAPNLGLVDISDQSVAALKSGFFDRPVGLLWPRYVYGQALEELSRQGATTVAFDVLFADRREDHPGMPLPDGSTESSDSAFARQLRESGRAILGAKEALLPDELFRTNAIALGDISAIQDADGILRRARAYSDYRIWNPLIRQAAAALNLDLSRARVEPGRIVVSSYAGETNTIPLDRDHNFNQVALYEQLTGTRVAPAVNPMKKAFTTRRVWDMGIVAAARELGLDLERALIETNRGRIVLRGSNGVERVIPVDEAGRFHIDWSLTINAAGLFREPIESLLYSRQERLEGRPRPEETPWRRRIALVGSTATGNNLTDYGATPLERRTFLTTRFLNVANSVITGRFIRRTSVPSEVLVVMALAGLSFGLGWWLPAGRSTLMAVALSFLYAFAVTSAFDRSRLWIPMAFPLVSIWGALFSIVAYRAMFEQSERRRIKTVFSKIVSPNVVNELLRAEHLSLGGARRNVTVLFADVRGFTEMTDESQARAEEQVTTRHLPPPQAERFYDEQSKEVLDTVNLYLGAVADIIKKHDGTLDKYIGDCVMAFWGAPTPNLHHAVACVRAAIEIQRVVQTLNDARRRENEHREEENRRRTAEGRPLLPPLRQLSLGTGINTGHVIVGLMGSDAHLVNFTVFGREVNLASRLESQSGHGRILIGEATFRDLVRDASDLAAACLPLEPLLVKGLRTAVQVYEVPWNERDRPDGGH